MEPDRNDAGGQHPIVDGREYEISFRASWLAGKSKFNARLYFNRLARTFDLAGAIADGNARARQTQPPLASDLRSPISSHFPPVPNANQPVLVSAVASDPDSVAGVTLYYALDGGSWRTLPMQRASLDSEYARFTGTVPGQAANHDRAILSSRHGQDSRRVCLPGARHELARTLRRAGRSGRGGAARTIFASS